MPWSSSGLSNRTGLTATASSATLSVPNRGWAWTGSANSVATAWAAAVVTQGGTVSAGRQTLVTQCISSLMAAGVWSNLDRLWLFAAENTQSANIDLVNISAVTPIAAPAFTVDRGYLGDGTASYVNTGYIPSSSTRATQNSASCGVWVSSTRSASAFQSAFGGCGVSATQKYDLFPKYGDGNLYAAVNCAEINCGTGPATINGLFHNDRAAAGSFQVNQNGAQIKNQATASVGLPTAVQYVCAINNNGALLLPSAVDQIGAAFMGASLAGKEVAFYNALRTYMTAVGVP